MNRIPLFAAIVALFSLSACAGVGDAPEATTGEAVTLTNAEGTVLPIDTSRSEVNWRGAKVTRAHDGGFNLYDGTVTVSGDQVTGVTVNIDMTSIWSDTNRLTGHLKSDDFFSVEMYPDARFEASSFAPTDSAGATHLVTGNLTMRGVTNSVTFPATISVEENMATANADFIINRRNWNVNYDGEADDLIRDDVRIIFDIVAAPMAEGMAATGEVVDNDVTE